MEQCREAETLAQTHVKQSARLKHSRRELGEKGWVPEAIWGRGGGQHTEGAIMGREDSSDAGILMTGWAGTDLELPGDKAE